MNDPAIQNKDKNELMERVREETGLKHLLDWSDFQECQSIVAASLANAIFRVLHPVVPEKE